MNNLCFLENKVIIIDDIKKILIENNIESILNYLDDKYDLIDDNNLIVIYKIMLNYNFNYFFKNLLITRINKIKHSHKKTWDLIFKFYYYIYNVSKMNQKISDFCSILNLNIDTYLKLKLIIKEKIKVLNSFFDNTISIFNFFDKININENNSYNKEIYLIEKRINEDEIDIRLTNIVKVFKYNFLISYNIRLIDSCEYKNMSYNEKIKYCNYIYKSLKNIFEDILRNINMVSEYKISLKKLIYYNKDIDTEYNYINEKIIYYNNIAYLL